MAKGVAKMILVIKRHEGEGVVISSGGDTASLIVAGFLQRNGQLSVRLSVAAPDTWGVPATLELRKHDQLEVGHPCSGHATVTVMAIRKSSKERTVQLVVAISKSCNANRLDVWRAIHGI